jgi:ribosomal protein S18 acetylase RimI-like enzyme
MITCRDAVPADGPALDAMAQTIWIETFGATASPRDVEAYLAGAYGPDGQLIRDLNEGEAAFRIALSGERIVGYAKLNTPWLPDAEPGSLQLSQLYVASDFHGAGIAQMLMDWTIEAARAHGAIALLLTVWEENHRAHRFYVKHGFEQIGDYAFAVGEQLDTDYIMRLAL